MVRRPEKGKLNKIMELMNETGLTGKPFMNISEASDYLQIPKATIYSTHPKVFYLIINHNVGEYILKSKI